MLGKMHSGVGVVGSGISKVVATLRADGNVYPTEAPLNQQQSNNLLHYEIRTEGEHLLKKGNSLGPTTVIDLGKQLLQQARDSDVVGVKSALVHGAPFASDWLGMSALHFAAMNNQLEICEILLQGGINMDAKTKVDRTPLHLACYYGHESVVALLLSLKCAVNPRDMLRMTPLHWAVEKKHKSIVRMLLKFQADVTLTSKFGKTPIALAVITEQADILAELEAARQVQANRKFNEETEKETSDAVNSIMDEPEYTRSIDDADMSVEDKLDVLENLRGQTNTNVLGNTVLNMLKSHGIADMMEDNDNEASKDMLNTALRNGRQLVLSEAGSMLLHETKSNIISKHKANNIGKSMGLRSMSNNTRHNSSPQKIRMNVIKQKESSSPTGVPKNKNIRIISLTDFKKLCSTDSQSKTLQKIPSTLASSGVVRQLSDGTKLVNMRQLQPRQLKLPTVHKTQDTSIIDEQQNDIVAATPQNSSTTTTRGQVGAVQTIQLRPLPSVGAANNGIPINKTVTATQNRPNIRSSTDPTSNKTPSVVPMLTSSEIFRQLQELRRHNEELRRRVDLMQVEKEDMLQRIERLEQYVVIRDSESDVQYFEA